MDFVMIIKMLGWYAMAALAIYTWYSFKRHNEYEAERTKRIQAQMLEELQAEENPRTDCHR